MRMDDSSAVETTVLDPPRHYADLASYIAESGDTQANVAARVGTTQAQISRIVAGLLMPRPQLALQIAEYAHIPLDSFTRVYLAKRMQRESKLRGQKQKRGRSHAAVPE